MIFMCSTCASKTILSHSPMAFWQELPNDLVKVVLSQPEISYDVKRVIGKEMGWNLTGRVYISQDLKQKLNNIILARKPVPRLFGTTTSMFHIQSSDSRITLQVIQENNIPTKSLGYIIHVKKNTGTKSYIGTHDDFSDNWRIFPTFLGI